jgi:hypothetical protein
MSLNLAEYKKKAHQAVKEFWGNREEAKARQIASGRADQGERSGVTSGKNMDGFLSLIIDIIRLNGLDSAQIHINRAMLTLPGFFRPQGCLKDDHEVLESIATLPSASIPSMS